jgi:hypothetical protein
MRAVTSGLMPARLRPGLPLKHEEDTDANGADEAEGGGVGAAVRRAAVVVVAAAAQVTSSLLEPPFAPACRTPALSMLQPQRQRLNLRRGRRGESQTSTRQKLCRPLALKSRPSPRPEQRRLRSAAE